MGVKGFNVMSIGKMNLIDPKNVCYEDSIDIIHDELHKARKSFIKIGWYLKHIDDNKMYVQEGYDNIVDFSKDKFNLSQPTTNRFIRLCEEFSVDHNSPELDKKYENFSVSQLIEMVSMKPEQIEQVTPKMTVREIKEIKKPSRKAIENFYNLYVKDTAYENSREGLKEYFIEKFGRSGCGGCQRNVSYECSRRGISLNNSSEITWTNLVKEINEMFPVKNFVPEEDDNIPRQTSIEKDFLEYMPEEQVFYVTSHKTEEQEEIEKDFPEYMPETSKPYTISHKTEVQEEKVMATDKSIDAKPMIIDGEYREIDDNSTKKVNGEIYTKDYENMQGQIELFEWLSEKVHEVPERPVEIKEVMNFTTMPISDYEVKSIYTDIFMIINMIDDYIRLLENKDNLSVRTTYMINRFKKISDSLTEQIGLDKEKMWKKVKIKEEQKEEVGEDALTQIFSKKS